MTDTLKVRYTHSYHSDTEFETNDAGEVKLPVGFGYFPKDETDHGYWVSLESLATIVDAWRDSKRKATECQCQRCISIRGHHD